MSTTSPVPARLSARERRAAVLRAAIPEFATHGYAAGTVAIAKRAGISHPYLFRLFPTKKQLFLACHDEVTLHARRLVVRAAAEPGTPEARVRRIADALVSGLDPDERRFEFQALAAAGDPELRVAVRDALKGLLAEVAALSEAPPELVARGCAQLMLATAAEVLELHDHTP